MLILPKDHQLKANKAAREGLESHYNSSMEKILNANSSKDVYWILGKVRFPEEDGGTDVKPPLVKDAFLYEVDNKRGVKTLLWVMHPDGSLRLPTLNKTISLMPKNKKKGVKV